LVINTTSASPEAVVQVVNACIGLWKKKQLGGKLWVSPAHLYCGVDPASLDASVIEAHKIEWPVPGSWPDAAVKVHRIGHNYVAVEGFEWIGAGLRADRSLMPVRVVGDTAPMPPPAMVEKWEKFFGYKHL
jgi:hypothetical protein